jgi:hypothetical protein
MVKWYTSSTAPEAAVRRTRGDDGRARRLLFELSTGAGTAAARLKHWKRPYGSIRPVCCTEKKIPAAVERSCWFARGTCRELALV